MGIIFSCPVSFISCFSMFRECRRESYTSPSLHSCYRLLFLVLIPFFHLFPSCLSLFIILSFAYIIFLSSPFLSYLLFSDPLSHLILFYSISRFISFSSYILSTFFFFPFQNCGLEKVKPLILVHFSSHLLLHILLLFVSSLHFSAFSSSSALSHVSPFPSLAFRGLALPQNPIIFAAVILFTLVLIFLMRPLPVSPFLPLPPPSSNPSYNLNPNVRLPSTLTWMLLFLLYLSTYCTFFFTFPPLSSFPLHLFSIISNTFPSLSTSKSFTSFPSFFTPPLPSLRHPSLL